MWCALWGCVIESAWTWSLQCVLSSRIVVAAAIGSSSSLYEAEQQQQSAAAAMAVGSAGPNHVLRLKEAKNKHLAVCGRACHTLIWCQPLLQVTASSHPAEQLCCFLVLHMYTVSNAFLRSSPAGFRSPGKVLAFSHFDPFCSSCPAGPWQRCATMHNLRHYVTHPAYLVLRDHGFSKDLGFSNYPSSSNCNY